MQEYNNIVISKLNFDSIMISGFHKKIVLNSLNLNLFGIEKKYQSKGLGKKFLKYIFKKFNCILEEGGKEGSPSEIRKLEGHMLEEGG